MKCAVCTRTREAVRGIAPCQAGGDSSTRGAAVAPVRPSARRDLYRHKVEAGSLLLSARSHPSQAASCLSRRIVFLAELPSDLRRCALVARHGRYSLAEPSLDGSRCVPVRLRVREALVRGRAL